ncbi:unnamed protein product, partial [Ixodes pacificus]
PLGNILVAAVTLYSGCIVKKVLWLFTQIGVSCISYRTFFKVQAAFLLPAIRQVWNNQQTELFKEATGRGLVLACDGRSDSPGHSAKYGTYTAIDSGTKRFYMSKQCRHKETHCGCWQAQVPCGTPGLGAAHRKAPILVCRVKRGSTRRNPPQVDISGGTCGRYPRPCRSHLP